MYASYSWLGHTNPYTNDTYVHKYTISVNKYELLYAIGIEQDIILPLLLFPLGATGLRARGLGMVLSLTVLVVWAMALAMGITLIWPWPNRQ